MAEKEKLLAEARGELVKVQAKLKAIEKMPDVKKWEPSGPFGARSDGLGTFKSDDDTHRQFGNSFPTKESALKAQNAMRIHNRLLAYVAEFDADWEADWTDYKQKKWFIFYESSKYGWDSRWCGESNYISTVYMSEKCAKELVDKLNSGEVEL